MERISAIGLRFGLSRQVGFSVGVLTTLSTAACWLAYAGPYRWLSQLQVRVVGADYLGLSVLLTGFGIGLSLFAAAQLARRLGLLQTVVRARSRARSMYARLFSKTRSWLGVAAVGAACLFLGARELRAAQRGERLERVQVAALEAGARPGSSWLELEGEPFEAARIRLEPYNYVPLVSPGFQPGQRVAAVLKWDPRSTPLPRGRVFRGTRDPGRTPVLVRGNYEDMGFDARHALVLELGTTPADRSDRAGWLAGIGGTLLCLGLSLAALRARRARASLPPQAVQASRLG